MNLDSLRAIRDVKLMENDQQAVSEMLSDAWLTVTGAECNGVTSITPIMLSRTDRGTFTTPFNQLKSQALAMQAPLATARAGVTD